MHAGGDDCLHGFVKGIGAGVPSIAMGEAPSDSWSGGTGSRLGGLIEAQVSHDKVKRPSAENSLRKAIRETGAMAICRQQMKLTKKVC